LTILGLAVSCGLVLAIHTGQARSGATATVSSKPSIDAPSSQWHWQNPLPQGNNLRGASFTDVNTGTVVGEYGTIVRTTDGGTSGRFRLAAQKKLCGLFPSSTQITERLSVKAARSLELQTEAIIGSPKQAEQRFNFVEFGSAIKMMEPPLAKVVPFLGPLMAEAAGFLNRVAL
jgi:hypothetical protein